MKLLNEEQEKIFLEESSAKDFFTQQETNEIWKTCYTQELEAIPIPGLNCLLYNADSVRQEYGIKSDISDETIEETINGTKLGLKFPLEKMETYPISQTAFVTLMQRAGFGAAPAISSQKDKANQKEMNPADKALVLNTGLNCFSNKSLILVRDEKVRAVLSGDENDYSRLPVTQLYQTLGNVLSNIYPGWSFETASVSHLFSSILVALNDSKLETEIQNVFSKFAKSSICEKGKPMVRLVTSDVGLSGANLYPVLRNKIGREIPLGLPLCLTHNNRHNMEDFRKNAEQITALFRDSKETLEQMMQTKINHPAGCLRVLGKKCTLPKKLVCNEATLFEQMYKSCYEIDVYYALLDILEQYTQENDISVSRQLALQENIARVVFTHMQDYDYDFNWE